MSNSEEKSSQMSNKPNIFPIDLAPKIALVKPSDNKGATVQTQQAFRTINQPQVRVVMPSATVQASGTAQIIQTHLMPQAMLKQVSGRAQISALPARTITQTSITVTRPLTPNTFVPRGPTTVTNIGIPRTTGPTTIRAPTPPSNVTNLTTNFVRTANPSRTPSPAGTIIAPGATTWMSGSSPVQLIRTNITPSPRTRIVSQTIPSNVIASNSGNSGNSGGIATISANIVSQNQTAQIQQQQHGQTVTNTTQVTGQQQQQQTFVSALSGVLPSTARQQTATLVYTSVSNPQQQFTSTQRLAVATPITAGQRQVRPIQLGSTRLPTSGIRVSNATNISIRAPNIPVLTPTSVLTTMTNTIQGRATVSTSNLSASGLSAARIIQVQQPQSGGAAQVISGRIGNVMTLHPVIMNATTGGSGGPSTAAGSSVRTPATAKVQPSLTITHVGKLASSLSGQGSLGQTITTVATASSVVTTVSQQMSHQPVTTSAIISSTQSGHQNQQQQQSATIQLQAAQQQSTQAQQQQHTIHQPQQITQIVGINQSGSVGHGHQIQIIGTQAIPASATVVPLTLTARSTTSLPTTVTTTPTIVTSLPTTATVSQLVRTNMNLSIPNATNLLPIAKVLPQQQQPINHEQQSGHQTVQSIQQATGNAQNVYIHARSPNPVVVAASSTQNPTAISGGATAVNTGGFQTNAGPFYYETISTSGGGSTMLTLTTTSMTNLIPSISSTHATNAGAGSTVTTVSYAPQPGSFAVVPSSNKNIGQIHGMIPLSAVSQANQIQTVPVRFNPQLIVDGNQGLQQQTGNTTHQIISIPQQNQITSNNQVSVSNVATVTGQQHQLQQQQPTHMIIPVSAAKVAAQSPRSAILRKRDIEGQTISKNVAKNLQPTLLSMAGPIEKERELQQQLQHHQIQSQHQQQQQKQQSSPIIVTATASGGGTTTMTATVIPQSQQLQRAPTPRSRPGSSGGSTTVSANSSPGLDQQEQEEQLNAMSMKMRMAEVAFKTVDEIYAAAPTSTVIAQSQMPLLHFQQQQQQQLSATSVSGSNGTIGTGGGGVNDDPGSRKRQKRPQPNDNGMQQSKKQIATGANDSNQYLPANDVAKGHIRSNKENSKPTEIYIKKPRTCSLLEGYKQNWKAANNHFQRYSDVKRRDERPPTIMDLANQANVVQKVNGWKIHHLNSQMEDLCELETQVYDKLASMLKCMERHNQSVDVDRVSDLIKGNMQRSKIVADGINDARSQIMKIFDHKGHVADIIQRCASKRNFKKRFKQLF